MSIDNMWHKFIDLLKVELAEEVRLSFDGKFAPDGRPNEAYEEMVSHAEQIRKRLSKFGVAIHNTETGQATRLFTDNSGNLNRFTLRDYGASSKSLTRRDAVASILQNPTLISIPESDFFGHRKKMAQPPSQRSR